VNDVERVAKLLCKVAVDYRGAADPEALWRAMPAAVKNGFRGQARYLMDELAKVDADGKALTDGR
jgi:hypothetical protein